MLYLRLIKKPMSIVHFIDHFSFILFLLFMFPGPIDFHSHKIGSLVAVCVFIDYPLLPGNRI